jgi:hypothetical protein
MAIATDIILVQHNYKHCEKKVVEFISSDDLTKQPWIQEMATAVFDIHLDTGIDMAQLVNELTGAAEAFYGAEEDDGFIAIWPTKSSVDWMITSWDLGWKNKAEPPEGWTDFMRFVEASAYINKVVATGIIQANSIEELITETISRSGITVRLEGGLIREALLFGEEVPVDVHDYDLNGMEIREDDLSTDESGRNYIEYGV